MTSDEVQVPEDVGTKTKKRKGAENKTPVAKKKGKPESIGEDQIQQRMAKDKKMTDSAVSVVSRQCILVSHHIVLKPY